MRDGGEYLYTYYKTTIVLTDYLIKALKQKLFMLWEFICKVSMRE